VGCNRFLHLADQFRTEDDPVARHRLLYPQGNARSCCCKSRTECFGLIALQTARFAVRFKFCICEANTIDDFILKQ
jgi:hypothetical protein